MSGQTTGRSTSYTTSTHPTSCKLNVERDMPTHFNTIYTGDFNGHSPLWGYPDHNATGHIIEDMLTASNLILLYDEAETPTLYHRSTGTTSTPDLNQVSAADIVNKTRYTVLSLSLSSVPWSIRPLATHDVFIFKVRFLAASHMVLGDVSPVFSIT